MTNESSRDVVEIALWSLVRTVENPLASAERHDELTQAFIDGPFRALLDAERKAGIDEERRYNGAHVHAMQETCASQRAALAAKDEDIARLMVKVAEREARILELERTQLPPGMEHCTIRLIECGLGHARLTATNWIDHGCPTCMLAAKDAEIARKDEALRKIAGPDQNALRAACRDNDDLRIIQAVTHALNVGRDIAATALLRPLAQPSEDAPKEEANDPIAAWAKLPKEERDRRTEAYLEANRAIREAQFGPDFDPAEQCEPAPPETRDDAKIAGAIISHMGGAPSRATRAEERKPRVETARRYLAILHEIGASVETQEIARKVLAELEAAESRPEEPAWQAPIMEHYRTEDRCKCGGFWPCAEVRPEETAPYSETDWEAKMEERNIGARIMVEQLRKAIESGAGRFSDEDSNWIVDRAREARPEEPKLMKLPIREAVELLAHLEAPPPPTLPLGHEFVGGPWDSHNGARGLCCQGMPVLLCCQPRSAHVAVPREKR